MTLDELDGECGFADTTAADDDEFVFAEELGLFSYEQKEVSVGCDARIREE